MKKNYIQPEMKMRQIDALEIFAVSVALDPTKNTDVMYGKEDDIWETEQD